MNIKVKKNKTNKTYIFYYISILLLIITVFSCQIKYVSTKRVLNTFNNNIENINMDEVFNLIKNNSNLEKSAKELQKLNLNEKAIENLYKNISKTISSNINNKDKTQDINDFNYDEILKNTVKFNAVSEISNTITDLINELNNNETNKNKDFLNQLKIYLKNVKSSANKIKQDSFDINNYQKYLSDIADLINYEVEYLKSSEANNDVLKIINLEDFKKLSKIIQKQNKNQTENFEDATKIFDFVKNLFVNESNFNNVKDYNSNNNSTTSYEHSNANNSNNKQFQYVDYSIKPDNANDFFTNNDSNNSDSNLNIEEENKKPSKIIGISVFMLILAVILLVIVLLIIFIYVAKKRVNSTSIEDYHRADLNSSDYNIKTQT